MTTSIPGPERMRESIAPFLSFFGGPFDRLTGQTDVANFAVGNPQGMPLASYVDALERHVHRVLVMRGTVVEVPGWSRVSLTASDEMVEAGIPRFAAARAEALG